MRTQKNVTLADLQHIPYGTMLAYAAGMPEVFTSRPNVARFVNAMLTTTMIVDPVFLGGGTTSVVGQRGSTFLRLTIK